jgi:hypothetical protein
MGTDGDPGSCKKGISFYSHAMNEYIAVMTGAWNREVSRLTKKYKQKPGFVTHLLENT